MRKLKLNDDAITRILDELDEQEQLETPPEQGQPKRFPYRACSLRVVIQQSRDQVVSYAVPTRTIAREGITFLIGNLLNAGARCVLHLITLRNNWQTVSGSVACCRYVQGSACVHEVYVKFDRPIDPASFAPTAVRACVLLADDSPLAHRLLRHMLEPLNVEVTYVDNGQDALKLAESQQYDLILMDLEMPGFDGFQAVQSLRAKGYVRPIVGISSLEAAEVREKCLNAGCDDFLTKPPQRENLAAIVNRSKPEPLVSAMLHDREMHPLIDEFVAALPGRIKKLEIAFADESVKQLAIEIRKLKGEASGFGFEPIGSMAGEIEAAIKLRKPLSDIRFKLSELIRLCLAARPATCIEPERNQTLPTPPANGNGSAEQPPGERSQQPAAIEA